MNVPSPAEVRIHLLEHNDIDKNDIKFEQTNSAKSPTPPKKLSKNVIFYSKNYLKM